MENINDFTGLPIPTAREITIGFDCDDVLFECIKPAVEQANRDYGLELRPGDMRGWQYDENGFDKIYSYFTEPDFVASQQPLLGAQDFIRKVCTLPNVQVFFITAVPINVMHIRAAMLQKYFPQVPAKNYILSSSKQVASFDIFVDDAPHNLFANSSKYRIVRRHRWNDNISGMLSYYTFDELWVLVNRIISRERPGISYKVRSPQVVALVGPPGRHKNEIAECLVKAGFYRTPSFTTKPNAERRYYTILSDEEFDRRIQTGEFPEVTVYGTHRYALPIHAYQYALTMGRNIVSVVDMCGATHLLSKFPTTVIYVDRRYQDILNDIVSSGDGRREQLTRIMALQSEQANVELCDFRIPPDDSIENAAQRIINLFAN